MKNNSANEVFAWDKLLSQYGIRARKRWPFKGYRSLYAILGSIAKKWDKLGKDKQDSLTKSFAGEKSQEELKKYLQN